jgi:hypothetical protein
MQGNKQQQWMAKWSGWELKTITQFISLRNYKNKKPNHGYGKMQMDFTLEFFLLL